MMKNFGSWVSDMANSIEDASEIKKNAKGEEIKVEYSLRKLAFRMALNKMGREPTNYNDIITFIEYYQEYLFGMELQSDYEMAVFFKDDEKMVDFYKILKNKIGVGE